LSGGVRSSTARRAGTATAHAARNAMALASMNARYPAPMPPDVPR